MDSLHATIEEFAADGYTQATAIALGRMTRLRRTLASQWAYHRAAIKAVALSPSISRMRRLKTSR
jgi:hypothetical protein